MGKERTRAGTAGPAPAAIAVVDFGPVPVHAVSLAEALDIVTRRAKSGEGGFVLTPNVDHLSLAARHAALAAAYQHCFLSLADGKPLVVMSRLLGLPLREKVSGADMFEPLMARCALEGLPVFFLGATESACREAVRKLRAAHPSIEVVGSDSSVIDLERDSGHAAAVLRRARDLGARMIVVCLPTLKQLMLHEFEDEYRPAVGVGAGASLSFFVGEVTRAPAWMSRVGLEWFHRLCQEPGRLWRRYLLESGWTLGIFARMVLDRATGRRLVRRVSLSPVRRNSPREPSSDMWPLP
jgi:N-acetylglucosaminyldiphosphoundecaprenol N-acetyl-beta-D-mannosaminyltransferase